VDIALSNGGHMILQHVSLATNEPTSDWIFTA